MLERAQELLYIYQRDLVQNSNSYWTLLWCVTIVSVSSTGVGISCSVERLKNVAVSLSISLTPVKRVVTHYQKGEATARHNPGFPDSLATKSVATNSHEFFII